MKRREVLFADVDRLAAPIHPSEGEPGRDRRVRRAVAEHLSPKQREVVEAYFFEGLSQSEIATRLGIRQQVVHKRIFGVRRNGRSIGGALRRLRGPLADFAPRSIDASEES
ncbi:MAG: sigma factor-like helix-turn-helix DNA-binding protein [Myxococcota bacterium]